MKKLLTLALLTGLAYSVYLFQNDDSSIIRIDEIKSGAYQALTFNAERSAYPEKHIPVGAYSKAWEKLKTKTVVKRGGDEPEPWESLGPLNRGGRTLALALNPQNPNTLYAGSASGGLWRSYSAGVGVEAWEQVQIDYPVLGVSTITFAPGDSMTMYIGTGEVYNYFEAGTGAAYRATRGSWGIGILKSIDGGQTWSKSLDWSYNQNHGIWAIKIDPNNADLIYAATTEGVYKSTDAGANWDLVLNVTMGTDLVIKPSNPNHVVVTCGNLGSAGYGVYKTTDGGVSWSKIENGLPTTYLGKGQLAMAPSDEDILYVSIGNGFSSADGASWLCRSTDFGTTWEIRNTEDYSQWQGWFAHDVVVSPDDPNYLVVIGIQVWVSDDGGQTIYLESEGGVGYSNPPIEGPDGNENYVHSDCHDVIFHPNNSNVVFVASDGGIHRSDDGGQTWSSRNGSYQTTQFYNGTSTSLVDEDFYIGGLQDNGTIVWNGDQTWSRVFGGDGSWSASSPTNSDEFFVSYQFLNMRKTTNGGQDFSFINNQNIQVWPTSFIAPYVIAPTDGNIVYAASSVIGKSIDNGDNWTVLNGGGQLDGNPVLALEVSPQNEDVVYAATAPYEGNRGHVFRTTNGNSFVNVTADLPDRYPMDFTVDPTDESIAYITFAGFGSGHVYKTENYGASWEDVSEGLPDVPTNAVIVDPEFPNNVYVGNDLGVFVSTDWGYSWEPYQTGMPSTAMIFDLKISPLDRKLRVATHGNGAYQRDLLEEEFVSTENLVLDLAVDVYPNPTSDVFSLRFENPEAQKISIDVLDVKGRLIQQLSNEVFSAGNQVINTDASNFSKGLYYIRMSTERGVMTREIIVQ